MAAERAAEILAMGSDDAGRVAQTIDRDDSVPWLGPIATPGQWSDAVVAARQVTIAAARQGRTITYGELRVAAYKATGMKVGHNQYADLAMAVNSGDDGCLLSAIILEKGSGEPGGGFLPYARDQGFDEPVATLQRRVHEHFRDAPVT